MFSTNHLNNQNGYKLKMYFIGQELFSTSLKISINLIHKHVKIILFYLVIYFIL